MAPDLICREGTHRAVMSGVPSWTTGFDSSGGLVINAAQQPRVAAYSPIVPNSIHRGTIGCDFSYRTAVNEALSNVSYVWSPPERAGTSATEASPNGLNVSHFNFQESRISRNSTPLASFARAETNPLPQTFNRSEFAFGQGMNTAYIGCRSPTPNVSEPDGLNTSGSLTQARPELRFASFFDRKSVDELVLAREKVIEKALAPRKCESGEGQQALKHSLSSNGVFISPQEISPSPAGVVDIAMLYQRYNSSESKSTRDTDAEITGKTPTGQVEYAKACSTNGKVLRTAAAARLAEATMNPKNNNGSSSVPDPKQREGGSNLVPSMCPRAPAASCSRPNYFPVKISAFSETPSQDAPFCRLSQRRVTVVREVESQGKRTDQPCDFNLSRIAPSGTYTHIIPVTSCGSCKGIFRGQLYAFGNKDRKVLTTAARVVALKNERYFVFSIPDPELIPSAELNLLSCVSQGSFGTVFKALWKGSIVAVKQAHGKMSHEAMRSVVREINSYRVIEHPFIVKYFGVCVEENFVALITEYLEGGNLFDILFENRQQIPASSRLKMCRQLIDAVHYLHTEKSLVHRDLKTANLVIDKHVSPTSLVAPVLRVGLFRILTLFGAGSTCGIFLRSTMHISVTLGKPEVWKRTEN